MRYLIIFLSAILFLLSFPILVNAQSNPNCQPIFGGGTSCIQTGDVMVVKKIRNPASNQYVDNLSINDPKYAPNQPVLFQLIVQNTGSRTIKDITVTDIFPPYVAFTKGPGQYDKANNTITFAVDSLEAGKSRSITLEGRVAPMNALPQGSSITCVVNQAIAEQGNNKSSDNTEFCLTKQGETGGTTQPQPTTDQPQAVTPTRAPVGPTGKPVPTGTKLPVYETPNQQTSPRTGPEALALISLIPAGIAGLYLRKRTA
jgi:uncharacterized repeat protein (TIGR01451 family)